MLTKTYRLTRGERLSAGRNLSRAGEAQAVLGQDPLGAPPLSSAYTCSLLIAEEAALVLGGAGLVGAHAAVVFPDYRRAPEAQYPLPD